MLPKYYRIFRVCALLGILSIYGIDAVRWGDWVTGPADAVALGHHMEYKYVPITRPVNIKRARRECRLDGGDLLHSPSRRLLRRFFTQQIGEPGHVTESDPWRVWAYTRNANGRVTGRSCRTLEISPRWRIRRSSCGNSRDVDGFICVRPSDGTTTDMVTEEFETMDVAMMDASVSMEAVGLWCCLQCELPC